MLFQCLPLLFSEVNMCGQCGAHFFFLTGRITLQEKQQCRECRPKTEKKNIHTF